MVDDKKKEEKKKAAGKKVEKAKGPVEVRGQAAPTFTDYAFAPGKTAFDESMRKVLTARPQTFLIKGELITDLASFIHAVQRSPLDTKPVRHLIAVSHANPEGLLRLPLDVITPNCTYEDLEQADRTGVIRIPANILTPRPRDQAGREIPPALHIKGCRIGSQQPFLRMLKKALGGGVTVTAPKHFHATTREPAPAGQVEFMKYSFEIDRPTKFNNRQQAIGEFAARGFTRIDGSPVPQGEWENWIPSDIHPRKGIVAMTSKYGNPVTKKIETTSFAQYRYRPRKYAKEAFSINLSSDPNSYDGRRRAVRDAMVQQLARYRDNHPFPDYVRYGYRTMDEFMNGWTWQFKWDAKNSLLYYRAIRYEYVVVRPITDPRTNQLVLNFYPTDKSNRPIIQLKEDDVRFFATV